MKVELCTPYRYTRDAMNITGMRYFDCIYVLSVSVERLWG